MCADVRVIVRFGVTSTVVESRKCGILKLK